MNQWVLDIGQQVALGSDPEARETNEMSPTIMTAFYWRAFQTAAQGRGTQTGTSSPAEMKYRSLKFKA